MKIDLLREFIILSKNLNFSETAKQLYITQSVLSKHIISLENEVGATLLTRNHHNVELTEIGELFLVEATNIVNQYDTSIKRIESKIKHLEKELKIGYLYEHTKNILVPAVHSFNINFPNIKLTLIAGLYENLPPRLKSGSLDLILTLNLDKDMLSWCNTYTLYKDVLCAAMCKEHPLATRQNISISDLASEHIFLPSNEIFRGYGAFTNKLLGLESLHKDMVFTYECIYSSLLIVEAGQGIAIIPKMFKANRNNNICFLPFKGDEYCFDVVAAWRKTDNNPAIKKFIHILSLNASY
ncbi:MULTISPECIES: LysR family transcriptional regulator [Clostridium]|uniref:LysR family transcriptional regulator n=1 Tax=Clostridium TaxID=1485 RepID=UPI000826C186|nr:MULTISPECIES: LysR family transcriptional regulator [Clostridium]PJI07236.1 LysR family transcriptional regulator [Clostridium sp. CT7]